MIKATLFDKDGTLLDFDATWMPAIRRVVDVLSDGDDALGSRLLRVGGFDEASNSILSGSLFAAGNTATIVDAWLPELSVKTGPQNISTPDHAELCKLTDTIFAQESQKHITALFDVAALFGHLKSNKLGIGIASNDSLRGIEIAVEALGIAPHTDFLCGYDSGHGQKPGTGMVEAFCSSLGVGAAEIAVIGDNSHDLEMGRNAGAGLVVGVLSGNSTVEDLGPLADEILNSAEDLPAFLGLSG